jgi:hypothetical protein
MFKNKQINNYIVKDVKGADVVCGEGGSGGCGII